MEVQRAAVPASFGSILFGTVQVPHFPRQSHHLALIPVVPPGTGDKRADSLDRKALDLRFGRLRRSQVLGHGPTASSNRARQDPGRAFSDHCAKARTQGARARADPPTTDAMQMRPRTRP